MNKKIPRVPQRPIYPTPAGLVTSVDRNGKPNIITLGGIFNLSIHSPVWVGLAIRPATYSHGLIKEQGEFVVNLPRAALLQKVLGCGSISGRDCPDKFKQFGLTPVPAKLVKPPLIAECPVNLECKLVGFHTVGDHDLFIGNVLVEHVDQHALTPDGDLDMSKADPLLMLRDSFWRIGERLK